MIDWEDLAQEQVAEIQRALSESIYVVRFFATMVLPKGLPRRAARGWGRAAPIKPVRPVPGIFARGPVAKRTVRTTFIVFDALALQYNTRFVRIAKEFALQAFIAKLVVKALN